LGGVSAPWLGGGGGAAGLRARWGGWSPGHRIGWAAACRAGSPTPPPRAAPRTPATARARAAVRRRARLRSVSPPPLGLPPIDRISDLPPAAARVNAARER